MGDLLSKLAAFHGRSNVCRNLHTLIHMRKELTLPISVDVVSLHVRKRKPLRISQIYWPVLRIKNWLHFLLEHKPEILLGGCTLESGSWRSMFADFWGSYKLMDPTHEVFASGYNLEMVIPYSIHGDEGRGLAKKPLMVLAWQLIISHLGPQVCNDSTFLGILAFKGFKF